MTGCLTISACSFLSILFTAHKGPVLILFQSELKHKCSDFSNNDSHVPKLGVNHKILLKASSQLFLRELSLETATEHSAEMDKN